MPNALQSSLACGLLMMTFASSVAFAQDEPRPRGGETTPPGEPQRPPQAPPGGPGFGPSGGPGGGPGMNRAERKILKDFDADKNGWLNAVERAEARKKLKEDAAQGGGDGGGRRGRGPGGAPGGGGPGGPGGMGGREPGTPGPRVTPEEVKNFPDAAMFDAGVLRTIFIDFENSDWEEELEAFHNTDVEVPCTLNVDGKTLQNVGASFRGASSYMMIPRGSKRSFNLSIDYVDNKQVLYGERTLNLLNSNGDPSFMSSVLYSALAREHIPAPAANFVKVVVNGESWGVFVSVEQFNADFVKEHFGTDKGARWKVSGSPNGRSGLDYVGDDVAIYKQRYQIKSKDRDEDWNALIDLCRTLTETPIDQLEQELKPIFDIDGALWFLALDNALVNSDGYWVRASDYSIYRDPKGVFHLVPHDMNESFSPVVGGPGMGGRGRQGQPPQPPQGGPPAGANQQGGAPQGLPPGEGPGGFRGPPPGDGSPPPQGGAEGRPANAGPQHMTGIELDPLTGMNDATKPLRSRLLAVPSLRAKYLDHVRAIAEDLKWENLGPIVAKHRAVIEKAVEADTRKLTSFAAFQTATSNELPPAPTEGARPARSLRMFADGRSKFLQEYKEKPTTAKESSAGGQAKKEGAPQ